MVMDVMVPQAKEVGVYYAGVRGPERKYAFIDFETATLPAPSADSSSPDSEHLNPSSLPAPEFALASKREVARLASNLEMHLRVSDIAMVADSTSNLSSSSVYRRRPARTWNTFRFHEGVR